VILPLKISDFVGLLKVILGRFLATKSSSRFSGRGHASVRKITGGGLVTTSIVV
jgi:hypothetical protein